MVKKLTIFLSLLISSHLSYAQKSSTTDTIDIHKRIIEDLNKEGDYQVIDHTSKSLFNSFRFDNHAGLDTSDQSIWNRLIWKTFLNRIDTSFIKDYSLKSGKLS